MTLFLQSFLSLFAETDTVFFDLGFVIALVVVIRVVRQRRLREPVFWFVLIVTLGIGLALAYTVSNFGTLFRHRAMVSVGVVLLPLALLVKTKGPAGPKAEPAEA